VGGHKGGWSRGYLKEEGVEQKRKVLGKGPKPYEGWETGVWVIRKERKSVTLAQQLGEKNLGL